MNALMKLWRDEEAPTAVEYGVMLALIIVVCVVAIGAVGTNLNAVFESVRDKLKPVAG